MNMKFIKLATTIFCFLVSSANGSEFPNVQIEFEPESSPEEKVYFQFRGKLYEEGDTFVGLTQKSINGEVTLLKIEKFLMDLVEVNKNGIPEDIVELWNKEERENISERMKNANVLKANSAYFKNIHSSQFLGIIRYGNYYLGCVAHHLNGLDAAIPTVYPMLQIESKYYLTNELTEDYFYTHLIDPLCQDLQNNSSDK